MLNNYKSPGAIIKSAVNLSIFYEIRLILHKKLN